MGKTKALFLDRDGVINVDFGYVYEPSRFEFVDGIFELTKYATQMGYLIVIVTNQSGIARGFYTASQFEELSHWMSEQFAKNGVEISGIYHCPHAPDDDCNCRKPKSGMLDQAITDHNIDATKSWMIGDKRSDIEAANGAGVANTILITTKEDQDYSTTKATKVYRSVKEVVCDF